MIPDPVGVGARAFALKEAECMGWRVPEDFPEHESFEALIAERTELWREYFAAGLKAALVHLPSPPAAEQLAIAARRLLDAALGTELPRDNTSRLAVLAALKPFEGTDK